MSAPITEAHRDLVRSVWDGMRDEKTTFEECAQLIADSEARALSVVCGRHVALLAERDQLRSALALGQQNCDDAYDDLRAERDAARAEAEKAKGYIALQVARAETAEAEVERLKDQGRTACDLFDDLKRMQARAERAEAILGKLQELHGCSREMVFHWCENAAQRSLGLGKVQAELAAERARLDWLEKANSSKFSPLWDQDWIHIRSAIDAAMKEGAKL
jgi:hypothetical protein